MHLWLFVITAVISAIIIYIYRIITYFKRCDIPHKMPLPFVGNTLPVFLKKCHMVEYICEYSKNWPDSKYVGFYMFNKPNIIVSDIEIIRELTLKNFDTFHDHDAFFNPDTDPMFGRTLFSLKGNKWRETRAILSPSFTANKLRQMFELMTECAQNFTEFVTDNFNHGNYEMEIKDAFSKYTNDVIATCAFGISINSLKNPDNKFFVLGKRGAKMTTLQGFKILISRLMPILTKVLNLQVFDAELTNFFFNIIKSNVDIRKKEGIFRPDMLQLMIESGKKSNDYEMDYVDMTSQAFGFFLGGFETSSTLMAYAAIELSKNQDVQNRLITEIDEILDQTNGKPSYQDINSMPYLEALFYETLRYYPISGVVDRVCKSDFELPPCLPGKKPYKIKSGEIVWIPSYRIHNDPKYYENPEKFSPERFINQKMSTNMPTFLGFGIGPRSCIGNRFALLESKIVLFNLLAKCKLEISSKLEHPVTYTTDSMIPLIKGGFWVRIELRNSK